MKLSFRRLSDENIQDDKYSTCPKKGLAVSIERENIEGSNDDIKIIEERCISYNAEKCDEMDIDLALGCAVGSMLKACHDTSFSANFDLEFDAENDSLLMNCHNGCSELCNFLNFSTLETEASFDSGSIFGV